MLLQALSICPTCSGRYRGALTCCPFDGATLQPLDDELSGVRLADRFVIASLIGVGSIGAVYRARDEANGQLVAIKVLHADLTKEAAHRERFMRESRAIMRARHPSVVHVLATGDGNEARCWFAMALYAGPTLAARLEQQGTLSSGEARALIGRLASALAVAHAAGVVHRDLKASNVLLHEAEPRAIPVLVDFGLASVQGEPGLTETGELIGSPHTMSPEQIRGEPPCPAMDLYALGCLWFQMLTGRPPFVGTTSAVLDAHLTTLAPTVVSFDVAAPERDAELIAGLLAKEAAGRTRALAELVATEPRGL